jgi:hypothetical protein
MQFILRKDAVPTIDSVSSEREGILTERDKRQVSLVIMGNGMNRIYMII